MSDKIRKDNEEIVARFFTLTTVVNGRIKYLIGHILNPESWLTSDWKRARKFLDPISVEEFLSTKKEEKIRNSDFKITEHVFDQFSAEKYKLI